MRNLIHCRRGATAIEYGLFAALVAILLSSGISTIGEKIGSSFSEAGAAMAAAPKTGVGLPVPEGDMPTDLSNESQNLTQNIW